MASHGIDSSIAYCNEALAVDPEFAAAYTAGAKEALGDLADALAIVNQRKAADGRTEPAALIAYI